MQWSNMRFERARMRREPGRRVVREGEARRGLEIGVIGGGRRNFTIAREENCGGMVGRVGRRVFGIGFVGLTSLCEVSVRFTPAKLLMSMLVLRLLLLLVAVAQLMENFPCR